MIIEESYTFDDVLLQPAYSKIGPADANVATFISKNIKLNIPLISAAMDTVTEHRLAITMAQLGGIGVIHKNFSIIVIDGKQGFGNRRILPSGPLRESIKRGLNRANAVIIVGEDKFNIRKFIPRSLPIFLSKFDVSKNKEIFRGKNITVFAGIAYPIKFFDTLKSQGAKILKKITFPDHYTYNENDLLNLVEIANNNKSILVTTKKDFIRIPEGYKSIIHKLEGEINLEDEDLLKEILTNVLENFILNKHDN